MSGPPDSDRDERRPSPDDPGEWPSTDLDRSAGRDVWTPQADQPPAPSAEPAWEWEDWPPPPPPDIEYEPEPELPTSDPWAEAWDREPWGDAAGAAAASQRYAPAISEPDAYEAAAYPQAPVAPEVAVTEVAEPQYLEQQVAQPQYLEPQVAEPEYVEPEVAEPELAEPEPAVAQAVPTEVEVPPAWEAPAVAPPQPIEPPAAWPAPAPAAPEAEAAPAPEPGPEAEAATAPPEPEAVPPEAEPELIPPMAAETAAPSPRVSEPPTVGGVEVAPPPTPVPADEERVPEPEPVAPPPIARDETAPFPALPARPRESVDAAPTPQPQPLVPATGRITTIAERPEWDGSDRRMPSTAELTVPWLIGVILLLFGMLIVLLALIFAGDSSVGGVVPDGSGSVEASPSPSRRPTPRPTPIASVSTQPSPSAPTRPSLAPVPAYGDLEMVYLGRSAALAPIYLLRHDFTTRAAPRVVAQDPVLDVRRFSWSRDGTVGAALLSDVLVAIDANLDKRRLADGISSITFGTEPTLVYAVRIAPSGADDVATVLVINFKTGYTLQLAQFRYARPEVGAEAPLKEAQFEDEGGLARIFWMENGRLRIWILGAGVWEANLQTRAVTKLEDSALPVLWSPTDELRVTTAESGSTTTLTLVDADGDARATTTIDGLVSHLRWAPDGSQVAFTVGRALTGGGVRQDLYLWNLVNGRAPMPLTNTGAGFNAEWLGTVPAWRP